MELTKDSTGAEIRQAWSESGIEVQADFWRLYLQDKMSYDAMHGKLWRAKLNITPRPELFQHVVGKPLKLSGNWIVLGDVQLPTTDYDFAILPAAIAKRHLSKPRQLLIVGDLLNMDCFASYEKEIGLPGFRQEIESARVLLMEWYKVFDRIVWLPGNHERRASRNTSASIMVGFVDNESWVRSFKFKGALKFTIDELVAFEAANDRDSGYVDALDFDVDLARDPEWKRS